MNTDWEQKYNQDYKNGLKLLLNECRIQQINLRKCKWIPIFNEKLSLLNVCEKFWTCVIEQGKLPSISKCRSINDIMHNSRTYLMDWCHTEDGTEWWRRVLNQSFGDTHDRTLFVNKGWE